VRPWSSDVQRLAPPERLRWDPDLRDELEFCERVGIPHSRFLDEWDADDQAKAIGYLRWKAQCCPGCGAHPSEWPDDPIEAEQDPPFEPVLSSCFGCRMTAEARKEIPSDRQMTVRVYLAPRRRDVDKSAEELEAEWAAEAEDG
jgi:hypothetical protein